MSAASLVLGSPVDLLPGTRRKDAANAVMHMSASALVPNGELSNPEGDEISCT